MPRESCAMCAQRCIRFARTSRSSDITNTLSKNVSSTGFISSSAAIKAPADRFSFSTSRVLSKESCNDRSSSQSNNATLTPGISSREHVSNSGCCDLTIRDGRPYASNARESCSDSSFPSTNVLSSLNRAITSAGRREFSFKHARTRSYRSPRSVSHASIRLVINTSNVSSASSDTSTGCKAALRRNASCKSRGMSFSNTT
mmetsp:Transcript_1953/g.4283  ORF Transcript_1953/g.4283 Transcript_1953/m.4283 type:complete len:201 (-) Transcript_1953:858-1460(-)